MAAFSTCNVTYYLERQHCHDSQLMSVCACLLADMLTMNDAQS